MQNMQTNYEAVLPHHAETEMTSFLQHTVLNSWIFM